MMRAFRIDGAATWFALLAIAMWAALAWFGVELARLPPFLVVGCALSVAGLVSLPLWIRLRVSGRALLLGTYGLFGFHFFLFMALRYAPPLPANLINYLWPLFIVVLAPLFDGRVRLTARHLLAAGLGLLGAVLAMTQKGGNESFNFSRGALMGYGFALVSAFIWATYSLSSQRLGRRTNGFPTAAIGLSCAVSGVLALVCHALLETTPAVTQFDWMLLFLLGLGPMGGAFFLWDAALKQGDARSLGSLAYLTPLCSTVLLSVTGHGRLGWSTGAALVLIVGGAVLGSRVPQASGANAVPLQKDFPEPLKNPP